MPPGRHLGSAWARAKSDGRESRQEAGCCRSDSSVVGQQCAKLQSDRADSRATCGQMSLAIKSYKVAKFADGYFPLPRHVAVCQFQLAKVPISSTM